MKRKLFTGLVALSLTGAALSAASLTAFAESSDEVTTITVGTMGTYSPFSYEDEDGTLTGYDLEVVRKIEEVDPTLHFEFVACPWESLFVGLDSDKFQMIANEITSTEERLEKYYLSEYSYSTCVDQFIVQKGRTDISTFEDLIGKKIGLTVGDGHNQVVEEWNEENGNVLTIEYYQEDITTILQEIQNGRIDATVNDPVAVMSKAEIQGLEVEPAGEWLTASPVYFVFKQDEAGKELRDRVDAALKELLDNGELSELSLEWFGSDYTITEGR